MSCAPLASAELVRLIYEYERSGYESLVTGKPIRYRTAAHVNKKRRRFRVTDYDGPAPRRDTGHESPWERLARFFEREKINPASYINIQFSPTTLLLGRPPGPFQLLDHKRLAIYHDQYPRMSDEIGDSLVVERGQARSGVSWYRACSLSVDDACANVITDHSLEMSPLFRYCLARSMGGEPFRERARLYVKAAVLQFGSYPDFYDQHWQGSLPLRFRAVADHLYPQYLKSWAL